MYKKTLCAIAIATLLGACASTGSDTRAQAAAPAAAAATGLPKGIKLIERVGKKGDEVAIPYAKYQLENGLTVIIHEDKSDPLVHVDVTYHVGSGREEIGKSGFAHFFEHMMFQGSENVGDEQHFKIISEAGGTLNGTTNSDRTNYFETVPANQLETVLWLEADRMGFLLNAVTQQKFEVQRETVKNERGQRVDNAPYGRVGERMAAAMYPEGHPYSWPVIGFIEDLNRVNVNDLKQFFLRWYGPNNAVLTIGGDVDAVQALTLVQKYFGSIPRGPEVSAPEKSPAKLDSTRYISLEDNVHLPLLAFQFPTIYARHDDEAALDVLTEIIGQGKTSLLYKNLVKNQIAVQASANHSCPEIACTFSMMVLPNPALMQGKNLDHLENIVRNTLKEFEQRGVQDDDLLKAKAKLESGMIYGLQSVSGKVSQLAFYETFTGNPDYIKKDVAAYSKVTKEDVMRVYNTYLKDQHAVIMRVVPNGKKDLIGKPDTFAGKARTLPEYKEVKESDLQLRVAKDDFDRSKKPQPNANPSVQMPSTWTATLANGISIHGADYDETPTVTLNLNIKVGDRDVPVEKAGLAALTVAMLNESTQNYTPEAFSLALEKLGSSVGFGGSTTYTTLSVSSLTKNIDATLKLAEERLLRPAFKAEDFARAKARTKQAIEQAKKQPANTANDVISKLLFGADHPIGVPSSGSIASVDAITLDDVKAFHAQYFSPQIANVTVVGNLPKDALVSKLKFLESWQGKPVSRITTKAFPTIDKTRLYLVDKPGAAQSEIRIGKRSLPYDATGEYYRAGLMNFNLGGAFNSRINLNLREDKGYTYGARSGFTGAEDYGWFSASAGVRTDATDKSIIEFVKEISQYQKAGMTAEELDFMKKSIGQSDARRYETPGQKLGFLFEQVRYQLAPDFVKQRDAILQGTTLAEMNALAAKHLKLDEMIMVVVGDKKAILPGLQALGYEIVELDADGNRI